jgi:hypothetical protein
VNVYDGFIFRNSFIVFINCTLYDEDGKSKEYKIAISFEFSLNVQFIEDLID